MKTLIDKLAVIQATLKAPKNQYNSFGKYNYRSCEDILEGLKLVLNGLVVTVQDDVVMVGDRIYIKAIATITDGDHSLSNTAFARESLTKKGMDDSQITGTASSYARKYALNGLFLIDDTKDADSMNNSNVASKQPAKQADPAIDTAINTNNASWVKAQYNPGVIHDNWPLLSPQQIDKIHLLLNQQG